MSEKPSILVVDDDKNTRDGIARAMRSSYQIFTAESAEAALDCLATTPVQLILSDMRMPGRDGLSLLKSLTSLYPSIPVILLTAYGSVETAVAAMKEGAYDFLTKPINLDHLELIIARALKQSAMEQRNTELESRLNEQFGFENIIGTSDAMRHIFQIIKQAAPTQATILIQGASGTGKELVAQAIHQHSTRAKGPFVAVHCAALAETLLESELFGHVKGAFTGAISDRKGRFELANGGTLFLDEISEIDMPTQVKLLRALETRTIERVGGGEPIHVDIRLVAATNRSLADWVAQGKFREDLYFRLNVVDVTLPTLKERTGDIPLLCSRFIKTFAQENGKRVESITPAALKLLERYPWPGNVRELRNTIEKMVVLTNREVLDVEDVPENVREPVVELAQVETLAPEDERAAIIRMVRVARGNRSQAAKLLNMSRSSLYRKCAEYCISDAELEAP